MCKYCLGEGHPQIASWIDAFNMKYPHSAYGPGHITLDDYNLDDYSLEYVRRLCRAILDDDFTGEAHYLWDYAERHELSPDQLKQEMLDTLELLDQIATIGEDER